MAKFGSVLLTSDPYAMPRKGPIPLILLVEDNDAHAHLTLFFLKQIAVTVDVDRVSDGEEALSYLFERDVKLPQPALILLDLHLPKVDGLEVLRRIKSSTVVGAIPVVILSTSDREADIEAAFVLNANAYLVKPPDAGQYGAMIESLVTFWLIWNHSAPVARV